MLRFPLFRETAQTFGHVTVDPEAVVAVVQTIRTSQTFGQHKLAVLHLSTGQTLQVEDPSWSVAQTIWAAKGLPPAPPNHPETR